MTKAGDLVLDASGPGLGRPSCRHRTMNCARAARIAAPLSRRKLQLSRRLEREAQRDVELMWLTGRLAPDFKTIASSPPPTIPVDFLEGAISLSTISVGDTQIVITNQSTIPFCSGALPCSDPFVGFQFVFSSGVDFKGVSVAPASAADFRPNDTAPHWAPAAVANTNCR